MSPRSASPRTRTAGSTWTRVSPGSTRSRARCPAPTFEAVRLHLFRQEGFAGNLDHYDDPENSFLDSVLERRRGIPISLSVLMVAIGTRLGVDARAASGCPATSSCSTARAATCGAIPFHGGAVLDVAGCRRRFEMVYGGALAFQRAFLSPTSAPAIVARMLANLERGALATDPVQRAWMCELHLAIPGISFQEQLELADQLARTGDVVRAADRVRRARRPRRIGPRRVRGRRRHRREAAHACARLARAAELSRDDGTAGHADVPARHRAVPARAASSARVRAALPGDDPAGAAPATASSGSCSSSAAAKWAAATPVSASAPLPASCARRSSPTAATRSTTVGIRAHPGGAVASRRSVSARGGGRPRRPR